MYALLLRDMFQIIFKEIFLVCHGGEGALLNIINDVKQL